MNWLGSSEVVAGLVMLALAVLVTLALRRRGRTMGTLMPSALFIALVPVTLEIGYVVGVVLILHGTGVL